MERCCIWRRLDAPGHDACRLLRGAVGWRIEGGAVFLEGHVPTRLDYCITCDDRWISLAGQVRGWIGAESVDLVAVRDRSVWTLNGKAVPEAGECLDLDFGFTPASNLLPLRRLALSVGEGADTTSAWLDVSAGTLQPLMQRYERRGTDAYWYQSPRFEYSAILEVESCGLVRRYPGLWEMQA